MADMTDNVNKHNSAADIKKLEAEIEKGKGSKLAQASAFKGKEGVSKPSGNSSGSTDQALGGKKPSYNSESYAKQGGKNGKAANTGKK